MKKHLLSMSNEARNRSLLLLFVLLISAASAWAGQYTKTYNYFWTDTQSYEWKNYFCADPNQELGCAIGTLTDYTICSPKTYYRVSSVKVVAGVIAGTTEFEGANVTLSANGQPSQAMTVLPYSQYPNNDFSQLNTIPTEEFTFDFTDEPLENAEVAITFSVNDHPQYGDNGGVDLYVQSVTVTYESNMTVGGVAVTQENMSGIIGDNIEGMVTYDEDTNTLTLTNANITSGGIQTDDDLNIVVIGDANYISNGTITTTKTNGTLTFKSAGESLAALQYSPSSVDATGFATVNYDGLYLTADNSRDLKYSSKRQCFELSPEIRPDVVKFSSAKTYELWVGGVKVTEENKDGITSDFLTATESGKEFSVIYDPDSHKLSLKNVTLGSSGTASNGIISRLPELTIYIEGANEIICNDSCTAIRADADMEQSLTFTTDSWYVDSYSLAFNALKAIRDFDNVELSYYAYMYWNNSYEYANGMLVDSEGNEVQDKSAVLGDTEYYGLSVGGVDVTSKNYSNITGGAIVSGKFSYDYYDHVLTIDGSGNDNPAVISSDEAYGILNKKLSSLTVKLKGQCTIDMSSSENSNPIHSVATNDNGVTLKLVKDEDYAASSSLTLKSNPQMEQSVISGFTSVDFSAFATTSATGASIQVDYDNDVLWMLDEEGEPAGYATDVIFVPAYSLWVNGEQVTDNNKDAILSNYILSGSSIKFNSVTKTLTLNKVDGVEFDTTLPFIKNGIGNMSIHIVGQNELHCGQRFLTQYGQAESTYDVTFTTDPAAPGKLVIQNTSDEGGDWYTDHTLSFRNELTMTEQAWTEETRYSLATIQVPSELTTYGLVVGGVTVTPDNAQNIAEGHDWIELDEGGELSFDPESNTLTMKNVAIAMPDPEGAPYPAIVTGLELLTVNISGYNSLRFTADETYGIQSTNANGEITFTRNPEDEDARLYISTSKDAFDGFKSMNYENGLYFSNDNQGVKPLERPYLYTYYNPNLKATCVDTEGMEDGIQIHYSIDYVDESIQDVEDALFDSNDKPLLLGPCTFTAYAELDEITGPVLKAKVFAFAESNVTAKYGEDVTLEAPALQPAIDDADQITIRYTEYTEAVAPAFEPTNQVPVATIDEETGVMTINKPGTIKFAVDCYSSVMECWNLGEDENPTFVLTVNDVDHGILITKDDVTVSVTNTNRLDVLGDANPENNKPASVQFDGRNRLVLNNAALTSIVLSATNDLPETGLDVYLEGDSKINNALGYAIKSEGATAMVKLAFHTGGDVPGTLTYTNTGEASENVFPGFEVSYFNKLAKSVNGDMTLVKIPMNPITDNVDDPAVIDYGTGYSEGTNLNNTTIEDVLYTLYDQQQQDVADDGLVTGTGGKLSLVINSTMTDLEVAASDAYVPGTQAYYDAFKGLTFYVPASMGAITLYDVITAQGYAFHVRIGNQEPIKVVNYSNVPFNIVIPYACSDITVVKIYLVNLNAGGQGASSAVMAKDGRRIGPKSTVSGGLGGMSVSSSYISTVPDAAASYLMMSAGDYEAEGHGIRVNNADVTDLPVSAFAAVVPVSPGPRRAPDASAKTFIDASGTKITGKSFSRTEGAFMGVPEETLIYLPAGNTAVGKNFVIGGICDDMELKATRENTFEVAADFTAAQATFDREFTAGDEKYYTIFLPYALNSSEIDGELYEYVDYDSSTETVNMNKVTGNTTPNTAYFFKPSKTAALKTMTSTLVKKFTGTAAAPGDESEAEGLHGVYEYYKWTTRPSNVYCFSASDKDDIVQGHFAKVGVDTYVKPFRAYLRINASSAPEFISINWGDGTTSIVPLDKSQVHQDADGWYTITGFRLPGKPTEKGIYIHKNNKVVVK